MGNDSDRIPLWQAILLPALAGGMGWGIRGQYGHETGAMIAGVLVSATIALLFLQNRSSLSAARVIALTAIGISFGGSMTYGQTVGLTHNGEVIGNWAAFRWGLLGLFIKGGIWIGLAGAFLGIGLSRQRYQPLKACAVLLSMIALQVIGTTLLNSPYVPQDRIDESGQVVEERALPPIYFSEQAKWYPDKTELKPRREGWGGLLFAWIGLVGYVGFIRRDKIARNLAFVGFVAGGIGFATGQCVQAFHSWNPTAFDDDWLRSTSAYINWWNMMEITFGLILGGGLGLGVWWNQTNFDRSESANDTHHNAASFTTDIDWYIALATIWVIGCWNFLSIPTLDKLVDGALPIAFLPLIGILGGRLYPYLFALPIVAMPIAGKTLRQLSFEKILMPVVDGWIWLVIAPLLAMTIAAVYFWKRSRIDDNAKWFTRWTLIVTSWIYFWLNFAFFESPWPWGEPTARTPSAWIFWICSLALTLTAVTKCPVNECQIATSGNGPRVAG